MATLLYLHQDAITTEVDDSYITRLSGVLAHTIVTQQTSTFLTADEAGIDTIYIGASNSKSTALPQDLVDTTLPIILSGATGSAAVLGFGQDGSTAGGTELDIVDAANVLSAGLGVGTYTYLNAGLSLFGISNPAAELKISSVPTASPTRAAFGYLNTGDTGQGSLLIASDRVHIPSRESVNISSLTATGLQLYDAAIAFAVGIAAVPKVEGTLTPWETGVPVGVITDIELYIRLDITSDDPIIVDTTFATNSNGQFSVEDAALPPATDVDCVFIKDGKKKFHTITTS